MQKIGFLGMGVMGLPMAKNVVQKCGLPVLGYDVVQQQMDAFREAGGIPVSDPAEIYKACDVILQILPTHPIIRNSVEQAIQYGKPGNVIVDLSSTAPDIILELYQQAFGIDVVVAVYDADDAGKAVGSLDEPGRRLMVQAVRDLDRDFSRAQHKKTSSVSPCRGLSARCDGTK